MIAFTLPMERNMRPVYSRQLGGNPYEDHTLQQVLEMHLQGLDLDTPNLNALRA